MSHARLESHYHGQGHSARLEPSMPTVRLFSGIEPEMPYVGNQRLAQCANERTQLQVVEKDCLLQNSGNPKHRRAVENPKTEKI